MGNVTIRDVARRADVAISTVSRYLNGGALKADTRAAIEEAIAALGFRRNEVASSMRRGQTRMIGILLCDTIEFFQYTLYQTLEAELWKLGYQCILTTYGNLNVSDKIRTLRQRNVDGLILYYYLPDPAVHDAITEALDDGVPVILLDSDAPDLVTDKVLVDNLNASFRAVEIMIQKGHRDIAVVTGTEKHPVSSERLSGYLECMKAYGLPIQEGYVLYGHFSIADSYNAVSRLMKLPRPPTALFTGSYHMTFGAIMAIREAGFRIPEDISIIGFDNVEVSEAVLHDLTIVEQPVDRIGATAADLMHRRILGENGEKARTIRVPARLVMRNTVARPPKHRENGLF